MGLVWELEAPAHQLLTLADICPASLFVLLIFGRPISEGAHFGFEIFVAKIDWAKFRQHFLS